MMITDQQKREYAIAEHKRMVRKYGRDPVGSLTRQQAERARELLRALGA